MNKFELHKKHGVWIGIAIVVLGAASYFVLRNNRKRYANIIVSYGASTQPLAWLMTLGEGYLKAWSIAAKTGAQTFSYNSKSYNTMGGLAV